MKSKDQERQIQMFRDAEAPASGKPARKPSPKTAAHYEPGEYRRKPSMADAERGDGGVSRFAPFRVRVEVLAETARALLVVLEDGDGEKVWVPKSQLKTGTGVENPGDKGDLVVPRWLAVEKGWG